VRLLLATLALVAALAPSARADGRRYVAQVTGGSGVSIGDGGDRAVVLRTPVFVDLGLATYSDLDASWWFGGSVRIEMDGRASIGGTVRIGLVGELEPLVFRPYAGIAAFLAPFTLLGVEGGLDVYLPLVGSFGLLGRVFADAFLYGSDLPQSGVLVMVNGSIGVEATF
jgi:hypothetical protein